MAIGSEDLKFRVLAQVVGQKSIDDLRGSFAGLHSTGRTLINGLKGLAAAFVVKEAVSFAKNLIDTADELQALSEKTGIAGKDLSGFKGAAEQGNLSFEGLTGSLRRLSVNMVEAASGNKALAGAFRAAGVSALDATGQIRPTGDVVKDLADKFSKMKDGPEKAALAVKLFGKSGSEMIPFLNQGREELEKFGLAIDDDFAARADAFNDTIVRIQNQFKNFGIQGLKRVLPTLQEVASAFERLPEDGKDTEGFFDALSETIRITAVALYGFGQTVANGVDALIQLARVIKEAVLGAFRQLGDELKTRAAQVKAFVTGDFAGAAALGEALQKRNADSSDKFIAERDRLLENFVDRSESRKKKIQDFYNTLLGPKSGSILFGDGQAKAEGNTKPKPSGGGSILPDITPLNQERDKELDKIKNFIEQQQLENEQRKEAIANIGKSTLELQKLKEEQQFETEVKRVSKDMTAEQTEALRKQTDVIKAQRLALIEQEYQQKRTWQTGAKEFLRDYVENATDAAANVKKAFSTAFSQLEDTLVNFVKTGELSFKAFADAVIEELIRIAIRQAVIAPIVQGATSAFGFADGGVMTSSGPMPLKTYSSGGIANSPQLALFGEGSTPEAFVPLPDGRRIPVAMEGGAGGATSVIVNVSVESGKEETKSASEDGKKLGSLIAAAVKNELVNQKRPGGLLAAGA